MSKLNRVCNGALDLQRYFLFLVVLTFSFIPGCSVGDFVGAYFNTYYNAQRLYTEAENEVLMPAAPGARADKKFLAPFEVSSQTKTKFTSVIEKCSKLLQYHPESKLVDDALFMIGKSYYYQNEHQSAERKFNELISTHPESDLLFEARMLLAETQYRSNNKELALTSSRALLEDAKAADEDGIVGRAATLLAHIEIEKKDIPGAIEHYKLTAEMAETSEERSTAYRALAELYDEQAQHENAVKAYEQAEDASNDYIGQYRAELGQAKSLSKLGEHDKSLSLLESLIDNPNYREYFGEIDLEIGNVYRDMRDFQAAEAQYRYVDTAYARTDAAANSYYQLGLLYERNLFLYDSARVAYDKGKNEFPQAEITPTIARKSDYLSKYFTFKTEIARYDSIRRFILYPPDSLTTLRDSTVADSSAALAINDSLTHDTTKVQGRTDSLVAKAPVVPPPPIDTVQARLAFNKSELASLFYAGLAVVDSARYWYQELLDEHPSSAYAPRALYTLAEILGQDSTIGRTQADSLRREIVDRFPESEFATEARRLLGMPVQEKRTDQLAVAYDSADQMMKEGNVTSALNVFREIAVADTLSPIAAKAQYAIGWVYENVESKKDSSIVNYEKLVKKFPNSQFASLVRPKLAEVEAERQAKEQEKKLREQQQQSTSDTTAKPGQTVDPKLDPAGQNKQQMKPPDAVKDTLKDVPPPEIKKDEDEEKPKP